jgi:hypothetical protein
MSTLTTILGGDTITSSRTVINTNFSNLNTDKIETSVIDTDTALAANSDAKIPSQKAVKAYVDAGGQANASTTVMGIVEEATQAEVDAGTAVGATGARLFINPSTHRRTQVLTYDSAGSPFTWTKDDGLLYIFVQAWGGGGSGSADIVAGDAYGGGGAGYFEAMIEASRLGATETVTVGAGGAGVSGTNVAGNNGENSSFGSHLTALKGNGATISLGGAGGDIATTSTLFRGTGGDSGAGTNSGNPGILWGGAGGGGTNSGVGSGGSSQMGGGGGGGAGTNGGNTNGVGGTSKLGGSGGNGAYAGSGTAGSVPGGGGGGSVTGTSGAGGNGRIIVTEFYT